ncbi:MAG: hypothetical protein ACI9W2_003077 [Gammaproteobacteria bacterium]|jgi:hypothetical protein
MALTQVNGRRRKDLRILGWREVVALPELGIEKIKCKVDTGARTSAIHASNCEEFRRDDKVFVRFDVTVITKHRKQVCHCECPLVDQRVVTDSGGNRENRRVVKTLIQVGSERFPIELTLTDRTQMRFPMLLGRTALRERFLVNTGASYLQALSDQNGG